MHEISLSWDEKEKYVEIKDAFAMLWKWVWVYKYWVEIEF